MGRTTWVVQKITRNPSPSIVALKRAIASLGYPLVEVNVVPYSEMMPEIPEEIEPPLMLYGMNTLIQNTARHPKWKHGLFFDEAAFQPIAYTKQLGNLMLNADAQLITCEELAVSDFSPTDRFFLRPNDDSKLFAGQVIYFRDYWRWYQRQDDSNEVELKPETLVLYSPPKTILSEHRTFVLDGNMITSSQYLPGTKRFTPPEVIDFAKFIASQYSPAEAFVCDIALTDQGLKLIEFNCINGSGFYEADVEAIVHCLSTWQERHLDEATRSLP